MRIMPIDFLANPFLDYDTMNSRVLGSELAMNLYRLFFIFGFCLVIVGCQSWQRVDFESLPPTAALPTVSSKGEVEIRYSDGIRGTLIESLLESPKFPDHPDEVGTLT